MNKGVIGAIIVIVLIGAWFLFSGGGGEAPDAAVAPTDSGEAVTGGESEPAADPGAASVGSDG